MALQEFLDEQQDDLLDIAALGRKEPTITLEPLEQELEQPYALPRAGWEKKFRLLLSSAPYYSCVETSPSSTTKLKSTILR